MDSRGTCMDGASGWGRRLRISSSVLVAFHDSIHSVRPDFLILFLSLLSLFLPCAVVCVSGVHFRVSAPCTTTVMTWRPYPRTPHTALLRRPGYNARYSPHAPQASQVPAPQRRALQLHPRAPLHPSRPNGPRHRIPRPRHLLPLLRTRRIPPRAHRPRVLRRPPGPAPAVALDQEIDPEAESRELYARYVLDPGRDEHATVVPGGACTDTSGDDASFRGRHGQNHDRGARAAVHAVSEAGESGVFGGNVA